MERLKYIDYGIVMQEVPDEISLAINITECPHNCVGCHSCYLSESTGRYLRGDIDKLIERYTGLITCVCFMGGDQHMSDLQEQLKHIKAEYNTKTCIYSGADSSEIFEGCLPFLDYLKIGHYDHRKGGLDSRDTNQKFYAVKGGKLKDITFRFWKERG